jgi:nitroreductase
VEEIASLGGFSSCPNPSLKTRLRDLYAPTFTAYEKAQRPALAALQDAERARMERMFESGRRLGEHFHEAPVIVVVCVHIPDLAITDAHLDRPSIVGGGSIYPAVQNLLLACRAFGLGATPTTLLCLKEPQVRELLSIPPDWATAAYVPMGYPEGIAHGPLTRNSVEKIAFRDRWNAPIF